MLAGVDIGRCCGYGFSRSRDQQGLAETNCRAAVHAVAVRREVRWWSSEAMWLQDGDGADGRTGWPAVIRGRREQDRSNAVPSSEVGSSTSVKASAAGARTGKFGSGVPSRSRRRTGDGAGCRRVALCEATSGFAVSAVQAVRSTRLASDGFRGKNGGVQRHQDRPGGNLESGYRRTSIVRWSPVEQPRSPRPDSV
jgi:hypothetical protein